MSDDSSDWSTHQFADLPDSGDGLTKDLVFSLLGSARRRYVLLSLLERGDVADFQTLVDDVATCEYGTDPDYRQRKRIYVSLRQAHLPALDEASVVTFDEDRGSVEPDEHFAAVTFPLRLLVHNPVGFLGISLPASVSQYALDGWIATLSKTVHVWF